MKPLTYSLIAAAMACGFSFAQTTAYTTPVGYSTSTLSPGYNTLGLTLQTPSLAAGTFETIAGNVLTDTGVTYAPVAGRTYILEITSGTLTGVIQEVPAASISGSTITTPNDLQALGLLTTDTYNLRVAPTLEEIFTTTPLASGGVLQGGLNATGADVVWVPTGLGTYDKYFLHNTGQFRRAGTTTATPNVPLIYADGFLVEKKGATAAALTVTGEVKKVGTNSVIIQGYNLLSMVAPVGLNLYNAGLEDDITKGLNATGADVVWVQLPNLTYKKYFLHNTGTWRDVAAPTVPLTQAQAEAVAMSPGFLVEHKAASAVALDLNVPAGYSSL
jgi:hypothetical protein